MKKIFLLKLILLASYSFMHAASEVKENQIDIETIEKAQINQIEKLISIGLNAQDNKGRTPLYLAIQYNQPKKVKELLAKKDIEINKADKDDLTTLAIAVDEGNVEIVNLLLDRCPKDKQNKCIDVDTQDNKIGFTPLMRAARVGNEVIVKALLDAGAKTFIESKTGKIAANFAASDKKIAELIENKTNEYKEYNERAYKFIEALENNNKDKAKKLLDEGINVNLKTNCGESLLIWAIKNRHKDIIKLLIDEHANVNAKDTDGNTPLLLALKYGYKDIVKLLIDAHADVNVIYEKIDFSPILVLAVKNNHQDVVQWLINGHANINATDYFHNTPLLFAALKGFKDIVQMLLSAKAQTDVNAKNSLGNTSLLMAAKYGNKAVVKMLIDAKADVNDKNYDRQTALNLAFRDKDIIEMLKEAGAKD